MLSARVEMLDDMELYVSETHISVENPATMSKIYEDKCRVSANEIKQVEHLWVMLVRNVCDGIQAFQCDNMHSFVNVFGIMCGYVSRTNASDFMSEEK